MTTLFRNMNTEVVHAADCRSAGDCERWKWADDKTLDDVTAATHQFPWLHLCRLCLPGKCQCGKCRDRGVVTP